MTKHESLELHLRSVGRDHVPMTFADIEAVIGSSLPPSARRRRAWWSNNPSNGVITRSWLNAGYRTADIAVPADPGWAGIADRGGRTG